MSHPRPVRFLTWTALAYLLTISMPVMAGGKPACNDGLDNDGDGLVDMADPGCESPGDKNEANAGPSTGPGGSTCEGIGIGVPRYEPGWPKPQPSPNPIACVRPPQIPTGVVCIARSLVIPGPCE